MGTTTVNITAAQVKELRDKTNAPMMDCKNALTEAKGDIEAAIVVLRKKGVATAAKKATRATSEGSVASYIHAGGKIGVLVEVNCESDFVARTDDFKGLVHDIAMHIAATDPRYIRKEDVTPACRLQPPARDRCPSLSRRPPPSRLPCGCSADRSRRCAWRCRAQALEVVGAGHKIALAVDFHQHADLASGMDVAGHRAFAGGAGGLLGGRSNALLAQYHDGGFDVALGLGQARSCSPSWERWSCRGVLLLVRQ